MKSTNQSDTHQTDTLDRLTPDQFEIMRDRLSDIGEAISANMILAMDEDASRTYTNLACTYELVDALCGDLNPVPRRNY